MRLDDNKPQAETPPTDRTDLKTEIDLSPKPRPVPWLSGGRGVILGIGLGALLTVGANRFAPSPQPPKAPPVAIKTEVPPQSVTTASVKTTAVERTLSATGTVIADELIPVLSQATGLHIQEIFVDEGETVRAGQPLARLDDTVLQAQLSQATASVAQSSARLAELRAGARKEEIARAKETIRRIEAEISQAKSDRDLAKKRVARNRTLEAEGAIALDRLDEVLNEERTKDAILQQAQARLGEARQQLAELTAGTRSEVIAQAVAQLAEARSRLQIVRAQLDDTRILAPVSGKIAERKARVGDTTNGQTPLFKVIEQGRLELALKVPETQLPAIRVGAPVRITADADKTVQLLGRVREIEPVIEEASRQATVKVAIANAGRLKPGMFLQGSIVTNTVSGLSVPMKAVLPKSNDRAIVYRVNADNTVKAADVTLGKILSGDRVEILNGLNAGDRIVVKGAAYLGDGDKIQSESEVGS